jgi:hypothetical protein
VTRAVVTYPSEEDIVVTADLAHRDMLPPMVTDATPAKPRLEAAGGHRAVTGKLPRLLDKLRGTAVADDSDVI